MNPKGDLRDLDEVHTDDEGNIVHVEMEWLSKGGQSDV